MLQIMELSFSYCNKFPGMKFLLLVINVGFFLLGGACNYSTEDQDGHPLPNIILIITDDQGYGDLAFHGNPVIKTPVLDSLAKISTRFSQFYVSPVCAPTRSSLMTGRYSIRTGVYDTYNGGAIMSDKEVTLAEYLREAGYTTGIFGKWHLGDSYPFRPMDQGFDVSLVHAAGGIGQPGDFYENFIKGDSSYFDPILSLNGEKIQTHGYCSDVFTNRAIQFIRQNGKNPFFLYLSYNAPHTPLQLPESYYALYRDVPDELFLTDSLEQRDQLPDFYIEEAKRVYGMVTNIDDNLKRLFYTLRELELQETTLIIFITDNGPQGNRYNTGLRSRKGSVFEGGIRVPSFWSWPGMIGPDREIPEIAAHIDILPTLLDICQIEVHTEYPVDGRSLWPLLKGEKIELPHRELFYHWTRGFPEPYHNIAVRSGDFKLVGQGSYKSPGQAFTLYNLSEDPNELKNISHLFPDSVEVLKKRFDEWYDQVIRNPHLAPQRIRIGSGMENPVILNRNDTKGPMAKKWMNPQALGYWDVTVMKEGSYNISMRFFEKLGPGNATFRLGPVQRTVPVTDSLTDLVEYRDVFLLAGDYVAEGWYAWENQFYAPIYIEIEASGVMEVDGE
jgi:arylsulfatase